MIAHLTDILHGVIRRRPAELEEIAAPLPNTNAAPEGPITPEGKIKHFSEATTLGEFYRLRRLAYPCATVNDRGQVVLCRRAGCQCAEYYRILRDNKVNQHISRDEAPHEVSLEDGAPALDRRIHRRWAEEAWD